MAPPLAMRAMLVRHFSDLGSHVGKEPAGGCIGGLKMRTHTINSTSDNNWWQNVEMSGYGLKMGQLFNW